MKETYYFALCFPRRCASQKRLGNSRANSHLIEYWTVDKGHCELRFDEVTSIHMTKFLIIHPIQWHSNERKHTDAAFQFQHLPILSARKTEWRRNHCLLYLAHWSRIAISQPMFCRFQHRLIVGPESCKQGSFKVTFLISNLLAASSCWTGWGMRYWGSSWWNQKSNCRQL